MCGIAGIYFFDGTSVPEPPLRRMASSLAHRGPDEEGIFHVDSVGLVSRRLRIIDLSPKASQPMKDESARYHIVYNGEIYNFRELRKDLEKRDQFFSNSDTEVILRLFMERREETWRELNGMFAIALYDSKTRELFLGRDHIGIKPLYYFVNDRVCVFGSELKSLFSSDLVENEIDNTSIAKYLRFGYFPGTSTPYKKIHKLLPGQYCKISPARIEIHNYWQLQQYKDNPRRGSAESVEDELDCLLQSAVEAQMISDVPIGAFLSGGIDSSLIVALMKRFSKKPIRTFTVGFSRMGYYDEREASRKVAQHLNTEHHEYSVDAGVEDILPRLIQTFDEPFADSSAVPTLCLAELARKDVTVALSGTGGDEIFGGYRKYMAAHWSGVFESLPSAVRSGVKKTASLLPASRQTLWKERALLLRRFTELSGGEPAELQFNSIFSTEDIKEMMNVDTAALLMKTEKTKSPAEDLMLFDLQYYLPEDLLVKEDRCTMAFGLEARVPYLDRDLIEFMLPLPLKYKVSGTATKKLFRKVAARYLPSWILKRPKHGFGSPVAEWLRTSLRSMTQDVLFSSDAFIQAPVIKKKLTEHLEGKADHSRALWALLMLELWHRR
ncbi:MAG TPA: asparagine synthase (glutamine-hydrolyzing) [Acidobacteriota bacterium]|nr:asparagine synthase (glutamine-hydrolyzing) [Acidobacteriota bacterium]